MPRLLAFLACALLLSSAPAYAESYEGTCTSVTDGDSLVVKIAGRSQKVRLLGVDAPKLGQKPWGPAARRYLEGLVKGKALRLETDVQQTDKYGRLLAYAYQGQTFVNQQLLAHGQALAANVPPNEQHKSEFAAAQSQARLAGLGVWDPKHRLPTMPSDYRHQKR